MYFNSKHTGISQKTDNVKNNVLKCRTTQKSLVNEWRTCLRVHFERKHFILKNFFPLLSVIRSFEC